MFRYSATKLKRCVHKLSKLQKVDLTHLRKVDLLRLSTQHFNY